MPTADEQAQAIKDKQHAARENLFRIRWRLTLVFVLVLALQLSSILSTGGLWLAHFPYFNFAAFFRQRMAFPQLLICSGFIGLLVGIWLDVTKYRREEEKRAQERALADAGRQIEGIWPPAPRKPE